ncbi:MAG: tetratricopeptide repeat protein [Nitratireductor sp.]
MRIVEKFAVVMIGMGILAGSPTGPAHAFDPAQVFAKEKPGSGAFLRFFFKARKEGQEAEAIDALKYAAEKGDHGAQWKLGRMYQTGDGVKVDHAEAFAIFNKIVQTYTEARPGSLDWQLSANAMVALGRYYLKGMPEAGIPRDLDQARIMFTTAASYFDHPDAQYELAMLYLNGDNPSGYGIQAARMLKSAADNGHVGAEARLGYMLFDGSILRRDPVRGLSMMFRAQRRATGEDAKWITDLQEEALSVASEDERRAAIAMASLVPAQ